MASLKCSFCGNGIHYHGEPCDVEYYFFEKEKWDRFLNNKFDPKNKIMTVGTIPKLYRTDTILNDYTDKIIEAWKCPECNTFHILDESGVIDVITDNDSNIYIDSPGIFSDNTKYLVFNDNRWFELTEKKVPLFKIKGKIIPNGVLVSAGDVITIKWNNSDTAKYKHIKLLE